MVLLLEVLVLFVLVFTFVFMPFVLIVSLFLLSRRYRGMFDQIGFSRKEVSLLVFGSLSASLVSIDVPFLVFGEYLLAVNVSGAVIPTVLAIHLLRSKRIRLVPALLGVLAVALVTFLVTRVQPDAGIVAEFPWLFVPSLSAATLSLTLFSRRSAQAPAYAYATATLGSLIGADIFHLPDLFAVPRFVGSIGGAGVFDLVYLAGILAMGLVLVVAMGHLRRLRAKIPEMEAHRARVSSELAQAVQSVFDAHHQASVERSLAAVQTRLLQGQGPGADVEAVAARVFDDPTSRRAYQLLVAYAGRIDGTEEIGRWALFQAQYLLNRLEEQTRQAYAPIGRRAAAFAIDAAFMAILLSAIAALLVSTAPPGTNPLILLIALIFWSWSIQMIYFTLFEYFWEGQTPGKRLVGVRVVDLEGNPPDFITAFARNVVRILDFALFFYAISALVMSASRRLQRLGDMAAETVVVRRSAAPAPPAGAGSTGKAI